MTVLSLKKKKKIFLINSTVSWISCTSLCDILFNIKILQHITLNIFSYTFSLQKAYFIDNLSFP